MVQPGDRRRRTKRTRTEGTVRRTIDEQAPAGGVRSPERVPVPAERAPFPGAFPPPPQPPDPVRLEDVSGARLLASDLRTALLLANEARHRTLERLFGIEREQANLLTAVVALMLAESAHERIEKLRAPALPSAGEMALGAAVWREMIQAVAGPGSRDTPLFGTLVTLAVVGSAARPALRSSRRAIADASRQLSASFHHRYGHIVGAHRR